MDLNLEQTDDHEPISINILSRDLRGEIAHLLDSKILESHESDEDSNRYPTASYTVSPPNKAVPTTAERVASLEKKQNELQA